MARALLFLTLLIGGCAFDADEAVGRNDQSIGAPTRSGRYLFEHETFDGNGRTCATCHQRRTGAVSPDDARARFSADPDDPLFRSLDADVAGGDTYARLLADATFRITMDLPRNVRLLEDPGARSVDVFRGAPSTLNTPGIDDVFMVDGREATLESQARGAIVGHAEAGRPPTGDELARIAEFERSPQFYSSSELFRYARGGEAPALPEGRTDSERRGRAFFEPGGRCGGCHGGTALNSTASGHRFMSVGISERNAQGYPLHTFVFTGDDGKETVVVSADPGRALVTGDPRDANRFRTPTLWGISRTAPYFHDNSARTLEEVAEAYSAHFAARGEAPLTPEEQADLVAYLRLL